MYLSPGRDCNGQTARSLDFNRPWMRFISPTQTVCFFSFLFLSLSHLGIFVLAAPRDARAFALPRSIISPLQQPPRLFRSTFLSRVSPPAPVIHPTVPFSSLRISRRLRRRAQIFVKETIMFSHTGRNWFGFFPVRRGRGTRSRCPLATRCVRE